MLNLVERSRCILFLDIDGVVNGSHFKKEIESKYFEIYQKWAPHCYKNKKHVIAESHLFNAQALKNLDSLIDKIEQFAKVEIVISSEWRKQGGLEELKTEFFKMHNFSQYIVDRTTIEPLNSPEKNCTDNDHETFALYYCRASEIQEWLNKNSDVIDYLILDDQDDHLSTHFRERFIKINPEKLLTKKKVERAVSLLNSKNKEKTSLYL